MSVTILLADEDALRRDGLVSVLSGTDNFKIIAEVPDGEAAFAAIRDLRPDIAVVDLNLPKLHGIELVRRVRSEGFGTKMLVLAGTPDEAMVRKVVRAGADAYLLNNGPARHLLDAISYVRDGGRYFSPQLRKDALNRRSPEEPRQRPLRRSHKLRNLRDRIREEVEPGLEDRDYEIMSVMADGIRPILDRLEEIDQRVAQMEGGDAPVPPDPRQWLKAQLAGPPRDSSFPGNMEARLPELIEEAVARRFRQMSGNLQKEIEETHVRTLETFVKNIQGKLVQRVSALEQDISEQARALNDLREYSQRTEDNLSRLISGVEKLTQELPRRLASATAETTAAPPVELRTGRGLGRPMQIGVAAIVLLGLTALAVARMERSRPPVVASSAPAAATQTSPSPEADTKTKIQAAGAYTESKDFSLAEGLYKQVIRSEPNNVEALKGLASVLYREDKIDESASILDKIPQN